MSDIKKTTISESALKTEMEVIIPVSVIESKKESELNKLQKTYKINGFRPGKVPVNMILEREGEALSLRCSEIIINETIENIVKEETRKLATRPEVSIKKFEKDQDVEIALTLEFLPEIPNIDFKNIQLNKYIIEVGEKDLNESIERILNNSKNYVEQDVDYVSKMGDRVKINYAGTVDGIPFDGGKADKYDLILGSNSFIDTFEEQLVGKKAGDNVLVKVKFPENYHQKALAGKDAEFTTEVLSVSTAQNPELTDEFVKNNFSMENVEEFKKVLTKEIGKRYEEYSKNYLKNKLFEYLNNNLNFDLPETLVNEQFEVSWKNKEMQLTKDKASEVEIENEKEKTKKEAENSIKIGLILSKIAEDNKIKIEERDVMKAITERAIQMPGYEKFIMDFYKKNEAAMKELKAGIFEAKVTDLILGQISLNEVKTNIDDFNKLS